MGHGPAPLNAEGFAAIVVAAVQGTGDQGAHLSPTVKYLQVVHVDTNVVTEKLPAGGIDGGQQAVGRKGDNGAGNTLQNTFLEVAFINYFQARAAQFVKGREQAVFAQFQLFGHEVKGGGQFADFIGRGHGNPASRITLCQAVCAVCQLSQGATDVA